MSSAIIILAAGSSSRLGEPKQLLPYKDTTLLNSIIQEALLSNGEQVVVVLGAFKDKILPTLSFEDERLEMVTNEYWQQGMGSSIKKGVKHAISCNQKLQNIIITTCDQPFVSSQLLNSLIEKAMNEPDKAIVASQYTIKDIGVPVLFKNSLFKHIQSINDKQGAKSLVYKHREITTFVNFEKGAIDIDTVDDLMYLKPDI